jgi:hypothetical protein
MRSISEIPHQGEPSKTIDTLHETALLQRRAVLQRTLLAGAGLFLPSALQADEKDNEDKEVKQIKAAALARAKQKIFMHPFAETNILKTPRPGSQSVRIFVENDGGMKIETLVHLRDTGWIDRTRMERRKEPASFDSEMRTDEKGKRPDIVPVRASGFIVEQNGHFFYASNDHVLKHAVHTLEDLMGTNVPKDISLAPLELTRRCPGDQYDFPISHVSETITNTTLPGRTVRISGMGADLFEVTGKALPMPMCRSEEIICDNCTSMFALKVRPKDAKKAERFIGMSGSRVEDLETNEVVGVFHSAPTVKDMNDACILLVFSGPDDLRNTIKVADTIREKHNRLFELVRLTNPRSALNLVAPDLPPTPK